ncbi:zinc ribbon domain-containing protein [Anaerolineae bacterium CFX9]|jgi:putative FmdB family regulatory protein|nr:zinc ribbon domain-containing protein [Anaerolineae bacterium CFX9]
MPLYDYRCEGCGSLFEARHGFNDPAPACPACGQTRVQRIITHAPSQMKGMAANTDGSKESLRAKWAEETPKLREKLVSKLGEEAVNRAAPTLNTKYD